MQPKQHSRGATAATSTRRTNPRSQVDPPDGYARIICTTSMYAMSRSLRLDAAAVKVLAHPLRSRLLSALRRGGPATATALAQEFATNTGATSYHLRKLESVGLVVDTGEGHGKRRLWRAASASHQWEPSDFAGDEDTATALNWLMRHYLSQLVANYQLWLDVEESWPSQWRDAATLDDDVVTVTAGQLKLLRSEVQDVIERYRDAGAGDQQARPVAVHHVAYPRDLRQGP